MNILEADFDGLGPNHLRGSRLANINRRIEATVNVVSMDVRALTEALRRDAWRDKVGFSEDISSANEEMFAAGSDAGKIAAILNSWLQKNQPCIFGRAAATVGLISYCVLTPEDLLKSDDQIRSIIQEYRTEWTRQAFHGNRSAFIILAVSPEIAQAEPTLEVKSLAERLCSLYLLTDVVADAVLLDDIFLEMPGDRRTTWKWKTGVNYFCSQGDKRWWHDHRIPGGMAFSVNSVGHLVKSAQLATAMKAAEKALDAPSGAWDASRIDSLEKALALAMRTIGSATTTASGPATYLLPSDSTGMTSKHCPYRIPPDLQDKNFCEYEGFYHTDYTIPTCYFSRTVDRPPQLDPFALDFTYLFRSDVENPAFATMGKGQQIRADFVDIRDVAINEKAARTDAKVVAIDDEPSLKALLEGKR